MTTIVIISILGYFFNKLNNITYNKNPIMNQSTIQNYYVNVEDGLYLNEANAHIAVSILGTDGSPKYDSRYVRLMAT